MGPRTWFMANLEAKLVLAAPTTVGTALASTLVEHSQDMPLWVSSLDGVPHICVIGTIEDRDYLRLEVTQVLDVVGYMTGCLDNPDTPAGRGLDSRVNRYRNVSWRYS